MSVTIRRGDYCVCVLPTHAEIEITPFCQFVPTLHNYDRRAAPAIAVALGPGLVLADRGLLAPGSRGQIAGVGGVRALAPATVERSVVNCVGGLGVHDCLSCCTCSR